jgi:hypothetical protein
LHCHAAAGTLLITAAGRLFVTQVAEVAEVEHAHLLVCVNLPAGRCVEAGASRVVIAPYFLSRGRHIQDDIPALVAAAQQQFPGISCSIAEPIGERAKLPATSYVAAKLSLLLVVDACSLVSGAWRCFVTVHMLWCSKSAANGCAA